jgi:hypothetical protein
MSGRSTAALAALAAAAALAGCGSATEDLLALEVTGGPARVHERIRVTNDGRASCGGGLRQIPSQMLLDARGAKRALRPLARRGASFPSPRAGARRYVFRSFDGTVRWTEGAAGSPALSRATLLALRLERELCRHG